MTELKLISTGRISAIDALRGLAVILMVEQHLGIWLWDNAESIMDFYNFPFIIGLNAMGGFAAPAFITLAGAGTVFLSGRHDGSGKILFIRGLMIIFSGYMLNLLITTWFSHGSWYVLHMIGFGIMLSPLLRRGNQYILAALFILIIAASVFIQNHLDTPFYINNKFMGDTGRPGGLFRLAIAESQFPIFPWLALFTGGILSGMWIKKNSIKNIYIFASALLTAGIILSAVHILGPEFVKAGVMKRLFWLYPGFYPAHPPMLLLLASLVQFAIAIFISLDRKIKFRADGILTALGRASLSVLFLHIFVFREITNKIGCWRRFSSAETLAIIFAVIIITAVLCVKWQKYDYRFGLEWLLRKFGR